MRWRPRPRGGVRAPASGPSAMDTRIRGDWRACNLRGRVANRASTRGRPGATLSVGAEEPSAGERALCVEGRGCRAGGGGGGGSWGCKGVLERQLPILLGTTGLGEGS